MRQEQLTLAAKERALYAPNNVVISRPTIRILIYSKRLYDRLVVLGPVISENSSNKKQTYFAKKVEKSKRVFKAFPFNYFAVITGPEITYLICLKRTY